MPRLPSITGTLANGGLECGFGADVAKADSEFLETARDFWHSVLVL